MVPTKKKRALAQSSHLPRLGVNLDFFDFLFVELFMTLVFLLQKDQAFVR